MIVLGYVLGLLIGICLGMMGAGGAIMTIPVLVYLFKIDTITATFYSLFIVGITALIGSVGYVRNQLYDLKTIVFFGIPSIISVLITTQFITPAIPASITTIGQFLLTKDLLVLILFSVLMIISAFAMLRSAKVVRKDEYREFQKYRYGLIILQGWFVGILTGLLGTGGGFMIIPAMIVLAKLPMKKAVGTSLCIISINCVFGFISKYNQIGHINWQFIVLFSLLTVAGILTGIQFSKKISGENLKKTFAVFMLIMGAFILVKETLMHN